ncbi:MAG: hypothetical protein IT196_07585 [Acidimicrobiales bacterium]|nr:hypothetical protein [Acidimicrobiales bacterium]
MSDASTTNLEQRLERLIALHASGGLDDDEFKAAKAAILSAASAPTTGGPVGGGPVGGGATDQLDAGAPVRTARFGRTLIVLVGIVLGMVVTCLGSVFTDLQAPAGSFVCGADQFLAGQTVERAGSETTYNFNSFCLRPDGALEHVSQLKLFAVLWLLYLPVGILFTYPVALLIRRLKIPVVSD